MSVVLRFAERLLSESDPAPANVPELANAPAVTETACCRATLIVPWLLKLGDALDWVMIRSSFALIVAPDSLT